MLPQASLLSEQSPDALQHTILLRVIGVILGRNLKQRGEGGGVALNTVSYPLGNLALVSLLLNPTLQSHDAATCSQTASDSTYMLVNKQNGNVLALVGEAIEGGFDGRRFGLAVHNQKVLLAVWRLGNVL